MDTPHKERNRLVLKIVEGGTAEPPQTRRIDTIAMALIAVILTVAPLWAAGFATPDMEPARLAQGGISSLLNALGVPILLLLTAIATLIVLVREWRFPKAIANIPGVWVMAAGLGIWASASMLPAPVKYLSINGLTVLLSALLLGGIIARLGRDERSVMIFLGALIVAGSLIGALGVRDYLDAYRNATHELRAYATFTNPNFLAGYLLLTIPATLGAFTAATDRTAKLATGIGLALQTACLMLTASRAGAAMMLLSVIAWLVLVLISRAYRGKTGAISQGVAIVIVSAILASAPTLSRVTQTGSASNTGAIASAAGSQAHSAEFRKYTWIGTYRAIAANPIMGTGIGSYEAAYPRYTLTAFTVHAHNSYLQFASETGWVGAILLMGTFAAIVGFTLKALFFVAPLEENAVPFHALFGTPKLIIAGLLASLFGSMIHSVFDSDWYVVATLFTLCAVLSIMAILARVVAPQNAYAPQPLPKLTFYVGIALVLGLTYRGITQFMERNALMSAANSYAKAYNDQANAKIHLEDAATEYQQASKLDTYDPEPLLGLSTVSVPLQKPEDAKQALLKSATIAPIGRTYYRLGKFSLSQNDLQEALKAFGNARFREPRNLQNLRWLGDTQENNGQIDEAKLTYESMSELEKGVYGKVRAIPEMIETDFAYAHLGLGKIHLESNEFHTTYEEFKAALEIFRVYWEKRNTQENQKSPDKQKELAESYLKVLGTVIAMGTSKEIIAQTEEAKLEAEYTKVQAEWEKEQAAP